MIAQADAEQGDESKGDGAGERGVADSAQRTRRSPTPGFARPPQARGTVSSRARAWRATRRMRDVPGSDPSQTLVGLRLAIGLSSWLTPRVAGKLFGLDAKANPQLPYVARLFGARDVALAAGIVMSQGEPRSLWLRIGFACDLADAAAGLAAGTRGDLGPVSAALVTGTALGAAALGMNALRVEQAPPSSAPIS